MKRRQFLQAATAALAAPRLARAQDATTLKFIPQADLAVLDPVWTTADVTRNHAHMVFDTLYGMDSAYTPQPQMAAGQTISADGREWVITLRDNLQFHDGTPVLARDAVASIQRWGKRDGFGQVLLAATDALSAPTDKTIKFQLKKPFPLLSTALATTTNMCPVMPERLAKTDPNTQVTEMTGSGPFRFKADERVAGARVVYEKFAGYVPRADGKPEFTSGPKAAHFDRVVWTVSPDPATNAAALGAGEFDWWENPTIDLVPALKGKGNLVVTVTDHTGEMGCLRFNHLFPPFDNAAIRRIVVAAVNQREIMQAVAGAAPELIAPPCGIFIPGTPMASTTGIAEAMPGGADPAALQKQLAAAGYTGQKIVLLCASDFPTINAEAQVCADTLKRIGFNVDYQSLDWGTVVQRRASKEPPDKGGWNIFFTFLGGTGNVTPAANIAIRSGGATAWFGWPTDPTMDALRAAWFDAPDLAAQKALCEKMQVRFWEDPPYAPLGTYFQPTAFSKSLKNVRDGFPLFFGVERA